MSAQETAPTQAKPAWLDSAAKPFIRIDHVTKQFGDFTAVDNVSARHLQGRTLRAARRIGLRQDHAAAHAGRLRDSRRKGRVFIDGQDMTDMPPYERPVNMMFQSYALFPHMRSRRMSAMASSTRR